MKRLFAFSNRCLAEIDDVIDHVAFGSATMTMSTGPEARE